MAFSQSSKYCTYAQAWQDRHEPQYLVITTMKQSENLGWNRLFSAITMSYSLYSNIGFVIESSIQLRL
jgi:hypothetical protein